MTMKMGFGWALATCLSAAGLVQAGERDDALAHAFAAQAGQAAGELTWAGLRIGMPVEATAKVLGRKPKVSTVPQELEGDTLVSDIEIKQVPVTLYWTETPDAVVLERVAARTPDALSPQVSPSQAAQTEKSLRQRIRGLSKPCEECALSLGSAMLMIDTQNLFFASAEPDTGE